MKPKTELPDGMGQVEDEVVHWHRRANRTQSPQRCVGGWLYVTNRRLAFHPHKIDAAFNGEQCWYPWERIADVGKEKRSLQEIQGGSLRHRLRIEIDDGTYEYFVINKLNAVIDELATYLA